MTAKIEWYKEVLELEPNSKVFFPLARLLVEDGEKDEAMTLLEKGLERHPEYLEARLLRIELLNAAGLVQERDAEVRKLSEMFTSYAGFWQAWAACLASEQGQGDAASILRFLAAHFVSGPLKLSDVLNRGLDALAREGLVSAPAKAAPDSPDGDELAKAAAETESAPVENFEHNSAAMLEDLDAALDAEDATVESEETPTGEQGQLSAPELLPGTEASEAISAQAVLAAPAADLLTDAEVAATEIMEEASVPEHEEALPEPEPELLPEAGTDFVETGTAEQIPDAPKAAAEISRDEGNLPEPAAELLPETETDAAETKTAASVMQAREVPPAPEVEAQTLVEDALPEPEPELLPETQAEAVETAAAEQETILEEPQVEPVVEEALPKPGPEFLPETEAAAPASKAARPDFNAENSLEQAEAAMVGGLDLPDMDIGGLPVDSERGARLTTEAPYEEEEQFSLRTRSMAEVLAEQGDIQGALDIYQELAAAATSSDEVEDINRRIATLKGRLTMANASPGFQAAGAETAAKSKEKLIGMLEALAQGMEARAQG